MIYLVNYLADLLCCYRPFRLMRLFGGCGGYCNRALRFLIEYDIDHGPMVTADKRYGKI